jgi:chromosome segregation ATPase
LPPGDGHGIEKELMMAGRRQGPSKPAADGARAFAVVVEQLRGEFKVFGEALGGLRQQMTDGFDEVRGDVAELKHDVTGLKHDVTELKHDVTELKHDVTGLKHDVTELKHDVAELKHDMGEVKRDLAEVKVDLAEVKVDLSLVKSAATTHSRELREIRSALGNKVERGEVEAIVEHVVARVAER